LTSTCEAAISRLEKMAAARNIRLQLVESPPVQLRADPKDLELIWINLLENAVQYSPTGSTVVLRIASLATNANAAVLADSSNLPSNNGFAHPNGAAKIARVSVEDSGPGVPPAELPHIFERFHRGDPSRARTTGGFGLGLAICKALVESYGGRIEASNRDGQGTVVRVELPSE
jgi:signal transduction histidine kinase